FASGHTIGATLLYGQLLLFVLPALKERQWRLLSIFSAISLVVLVGFSRIALGAHFLTDVLAAILFWIILLSFCVGLRHPMQRPLPFASVPLAVDTELSVAPVSKPEPAPAVAISEQ